MTPPLTGLQGYVAALQAHLFNKNDEKGLMLFGIVLKSMVKEMEYKDNVSDENIR